MVDLYVSSWQPEQYLFVKDGLADSSHTIKIEVTGTTSSGSDTWISIDAFEVTTGGGAIVVRYEEESGINNATYEEGNADYAGTWHNGSDSSHSGGKHKVSKTGGSVCSFTFSGTGINWIGSKYTNRGIAKVYIDNVYRRDISLYSPSWDPQRGLYQETGLSSGTHTIKIEVTGAKSGSSNGTWVSVDAFIVEI